MHFGRTLEDALCACFWSRIAVRALAAWPLRGREPGGLYEGVRALDLSDVLTPAQSLSVTATVKSGALTHSGFVAQKTKDALVDARAGALRQALDARATSRTCAWWCTS